MKKRTLISGMVFILFVFISQGLYAQGYYRYGPPMEDDYYALNLTKEQMEKIDTLELELIKELSPLVAKIRSQYVVLYELEAQRNPDPAKVNKVWDEIDWLEADIRKKEILLENKIRNLLTEEQRAIFDARCPYGTIPYGRGGFGRGLRGGIYGYGAGMGRGVGRLGRGFYGYGRGIAGNWGFFGGGIGRLGYGRGPCGAGLGRWYRWNGYRGGWNWKK